MAYTRKALRGPTPEQTQNDRPLKDSVVVAKEKKVGLGEYGPHGYTTLAHEVGHVIEDRDNKVKPDSDEDPLCSIRTRNTSRW